MAKHRSHKQNEFLKGEVKRLTAENKRLKRRLQSALNHTDQLPEEWFGIEEASFGDLDKDEVEMDAEVIPCVHCPTGFMSIVEVVGKKFFKCSICERTKKC